MIRNTLILAGLLVGLAAGAQTNSPLVFDGPLQKLRAGKALSEAEILACREFLNQYYEDLSLKHGTRQNGKFPEPDRTQFYIAAIKTAMIDHEFNGGWPFRSEIRLHVLAQLKAMFRETKDPFVAFCAVFPALSRREPAYAATCYEALRERDEYLANLVVTWTVEGYYEKPESLIAYYLAHGRPDNARDFADRAAATGFLNGLLVKAIFLENVGQYTDAEACHREIERRHRYPGSLVAFYERNRDRKDEAGIPFQKRYDDLTKHCFPGGVSKAEPGDFSGPPRNGVVLVDESDLVRYYGLRRGMVITALDGYRVENLAQYYYIRERDATNHVLALTVWNGAQYTNITAGIYDRRLDVELRDHVK